MSKENLVKLIETAAEDEQLGQQLQHASSYEAVKVLAAVRGLDLGDLSAEEAQRTVDVLSGTASGELSDEEMELVSGGFNIGMPPTLTKGFSFGVERKIVASGGGSGI